MKSKLIHEQGEKTFALAFEPGDEVVAELTNFANENHLDAASFTAIGAFSNATLGYFDVEKKEYKKIPADEQVEVLSLVGDVAPFEGEPKLHAHWWLAGQTARRGVATFLKPTSNRPWR